MNPLLRVYFWFLRDKRKNIPSKEECEWAVINGTHSPRINEVLVHTIFGSSLEETAEIMGYTRERVRQLLNKGCRTARVCYQISKENQLRNRDLS